MGAKAPQPAPERQPSSRAGQPSPPPPPRTPHKKRECVWTDDDHHYGTQCGRAFEFIDDGPSENRFFYCPFCGGRLIEQPKGQDDE